MAASRRPSPKSIPILVVPGGYPRRTAQVGANYYATREMRGIAKIAESITTPDEVVNVMRRAMSRITQRPRRPGDRRSAVRPVECRTHRRAELQAGREARMSRRIPAAVKEAAQVADQSEAAGAVRRPGRALGQGVEAGASSSPSSSPFRSSPASKARARSTKRIRSSLGSGGVAVPKPVRTSSTIPT